MGGCSWVLSGLHQFWSSLEFADFIQEFAHSVRDGELSFDRDLWSQFFAGAWSIKPVDPVSTEQAEQEIVDSGSPFGVRLGELRSLHSAWPFVVGNLDIAASCWDTLLLGVSGVRFRNSLLWEFLELPNSLYLNPSSLSLLSPSLINT